MREIHKKVINISKVKQSLAIISYTAGLFDGEGHICILTAKRIRKDGTISLHCHLTIGITNVNREILQWMVKYFGGHINIKQRYSNQRSCWEWILQCGKASNFLNIIYPYLKIKKQQAKVAIEFQDQIDSNNKYKLTIEDIQLRLKYKNKIHELNHASNI